MATTIGSQSGLPTGTTGYGPDYTSAAQQYINNKVTTSSPAATNTGTQSVKDIQTTLNAKGANLQVDGIMGPLTRAAQAKYGTGTAQTTTPNSTPVSPYSATGQPPASPTTAQPPTPTYTPPDTTAYNNAYQSYIASLAPDAGVSDAQSAYNTFIANSNTQNQNIGDQTIPMPFITGQQASVANRNNIQANLLQGNITNAQTSDTQKQAQSKAGVDYQQSLLDQANQTAQTQYSQAQTQYQQQLQQQQDAQTQANADRTYNENVKEFGQSEADKLKVAEISKTPTLNPLTGQPALSSSQLSAVNEANTAINNSKTGIAFQNATNAFNAINTVDPTTTDPSAQQQALLNLAQIEFPGTTSARGLLNVNPADAENSGFANALLDAQRLIQTKGELAPGVIANLQKQAQSIYGTIQNSYNANLKANATSLAQKLGIPVDQATSYLTNYNSTGSTGASGATQGIPKGTLSKNDWITKTLESQGLNYNTVTADMAQNAPAGYKPALDNATGLPVYASAADLASGNYTLLQY